MKKPAHSDTLRAEAATWLLPDETARREKFSRERVRHHRLVRDLLLDKLDTHNMDVIEVGGGPLPVTDLLRTKSRIVVDPLSDEYGTVVPCPDHLALKAEDMSFEATADLVVCCNALDHVEDPRLAFERMSRALRPGGFMAIHCPRHNAITNVHPAHVHNLDEKIVHRWADADFETVHELNFSDDGLRYGWVKFEGQRGQPAFALLLRKCVGY